MEKLQELTEKIYREGVEKGRAEAARLVEEAKAEAARIVAEAETKAAETEAAGRKAAEELDKNTRNELKLYTAQALNALKSEIANMLTDKITKEAAASLTADKDFLGQFAVALAEKWVSDEPVVISAAEADALKAYFAKKAKALLDKGVSIEKVNGKDTVISVSPKDGSYRVDFGEAQFEAYFKNFLRPELVDMLF